MHQDHNLHLGINLGFAVNRYPEPHHWVEILEEVGVRRVQFVADLINPNLPANFRLRKISKLVELCRENNILIESAFTGAFTRVNHFGSGDSEIREHWIRWFIEYARQMSPLQVTSLGGHPGILSIEDDANTKIRERRIKQIVQCWAKVLEGSSQFGIRKIFWEPMSVSREIGHTIEDALAFQSIFEAECGDAAQLCLDLDHGDIESSQIHDCDPHFWIETFAQSIGAVHLKQTTPDRRRNMSFTKSNNEMGTVKAKSIIESLLSNGVKDITLFLELGFRERNPDDSNAVQEIGESVQYWLDSGL